MLPLGLRSSYCTGTTQKGGAVVHSFHSTAALVAQSRLLRLGLARASRGIAALRFAATHPCTQNTKQES